MGIVDVAHLRFLGTHISHPSHVIFKEVNIMYILRIHVRGDLLGFFSSDEEYVQGEG